MKTSVKILMALLMAACIISNKSNAQNTFPSTGSAGIGTTSPNASAELEIVSTTQGLLMSRMTLVQRNAIVSPATGLMIYQTNSTPGFYYYSGTAWTAVTPKSKGWSLTGNAGTIPGTNFIGTTDAQPLIFKVNNQKAGLLDYTYGNTGFGYQTLNANTGTYNTANGGQSLYSNTTGSSNTANGYQALYFNTTGDFNIANGYQALLSNTTGSSNTANGYAALYLNTTGNYNTANGNGALFSNTTGYNNTANGGDALYSNSTGFANTANGYSALYSNTTGNSNTANGLEALHSNTTGYANTANGLDALYSNSIGVYNTATGYQALFNSTGNYNTANGSDALTFNTTGIHNTANGYAALNSNTTGSSNTALGSYADVLTGNLTNATAIGYNAKVQTSNSIILGDSVLDTKVSIGSRNASIYKLKIKQTANGYGLNIENGITSNDWEFFSTSLSSEDLFLYNNNSLIGGFDGTSGSYSALSDERLKTDIKNLPSLLTKINQLKPVTYQFKNASTETKKNIGFIAQDVNKIFPELVTHVEDKERDVEQYLMDYSGFGVIAIKGIQELQQVVKEKEETIDALKNRVEKLEAIMETLQQNFEKCNPCMQTSATNSQVSGIQQRETINQKRETVLLEQNIPNPFNYSTTINYTLPQQYSSAQIIITDKSGKLLKQVNISGNGNGSIKVDASTLASGAYQYSLYVDGKLMDTKQMVLTK